MTAFKVLLTGIGSEEKPVLMTLDNCQWMDEQSIRILQQIAKSDASYQMLLMLTRPEDQNGIVRENALVDEELSLDPLDADSIGRLCESMAGTLPGEAIEVVTIYAEGSPFMASAVLRGMVETEVLFYEQGRWVLDPDRLQGFQTAESAGDVLVERLENLPRRDDSVSAKRRRDRQHVFFGSRRKSVGNFVVG